MATIGDRARELGHKFARQYHHNNCFLEKDKSFVYSNDEITDACIEMATYQRKIYVDKACEWVKKTFSDCNGRVDCITKELIQSLTDYMMEE